MVRPTLNPHPSDNLEVAKYAILEHGDISTVPLSLADTDVQMKALVVEPFKGEDIMLFY